jgi:hypothetical protein
MMNILKKLNGKQTAKRVVILLASMLFSISLSLQAQAPDKPVPLTENEKKQVIDSVSKLLTNEYIYPEVAKKIINAIASNSAKGNYTALTDPFEFADKLNQDLIKASNDKHFYMAFDPAWIMEKKKALANKDSSEVFIPLQELRRRNFAFKEVKILEGNIGYLNLEGFVPPSLAGETAVAAMAFLANTDAVIIDLRNNGGGSPEMVQLLCSYFFDSEPVLLVEFYSRKEDKITQSYSLPYVQGKQRPKVDVYILTSTKTFSAAESFSYIFKNRKRAVIIGETTGGGAHPVKQMIVTDRFTLRMPIERPIDPITKTDWEGTGVKPDVDVPAKEALITAQIKALEKLAKSNTDSSTYIWPLNGLKAKQNPVTVAVPILKLYAGNYGERKLLLEGANLYYQKTGSAKYKLTPMAQDLFMVDELDYLRIHIIFENGKAIGLNRLFVDGSSRKDMRSK